MSKALYLLCVSYLLAHGWYRDGDDPGIWHREAGINPPAHSFGEAIAIQFLADGINFQWTD